MATSFVPPDFVVPTGLATEHFRLRMLSVADVEQDFEAVVTSAPRLRQTFPQWGGWPREGFTLAENLADLERHQTEFGQRVAFAYTVVKPDGSQVLGCVYLYPQGDRPEAAEVLLWVRESAYVNGLEPVLEQSVRDWLAACWPFESVTYPGRSSA